MLCCGRKRVLIGCILSGYDGRIGFIYHDAVHPEKHRLEKQG